MPLYRYTQQVPFTLTQPQPDYHSSSLTMLFACQWKYTTKYCAICSTIRRRKSNNECMKGAIERVFYHRNENVHWGFAVLGLRLPQLKLKISQEALLRQNERHANYITGWLSVVKRAQLKSSGHGQWWLVAFNSTVKFSRVGLVFWFEFKLCLARSIHTHFWI